MCIETQRLTIGPVGERPNPEEFLPVFNSNPDFIEASDVEIYLWQETSRENSRCVEIRSRETGELLGTAALLVPHYDEPIPWIGLLLIGGDRQRQGLEAEAAGAIERALASEGWTELHLGVMKANPAARRFWEGFGYEVYDERLDNDKRPVWVMRKQL